MEQEKKLLPFDKKIELVTNTIRKLKIDILENRNLLIENSEALFNKVYFLRPTYTDRPNNRRVTTEIIIYVWSAVIDEAVVMLYTEVMMQSITQIDEEKDLWNLVNFCTELIDEYIKENNVVDSKGNIIKAPYFLHAKCQFAGLITE